MLMFLISWILSFSYKEGWLYSGNDVLCREILSAAAYVWNLTLRWIFVPFGITKSLYDDDGTLFSLTNFLSTILLISSLPLFLSYLFSLNLSVSFCSFFLHVSNAMIITLFITLFFFHFFFFLLFFEMNLTLPWINKKKEKLIPGLSNSLILRRLFWTKEVQSTKFALSKIQSSFWKFNSA